MNAIYDEEQLHVGAEGGDIYSGNTSTISISYNFNHCKSLFLIQTCLVLTHQQVLQSFSWKMRMSCLYVKMVKMTDEIHLLLGKAISPS